MSSRQSGDGWSSQRSTKRDSGFSDIVSAFPTTGGTRRASWLRDQQKDVYPPKVSAAEDRGPSPVYRLYPHHIAGGGRRLHALKDTRALVVQTTTSQRPPHEAAIYTPVQDFNFETQRSRATESARNSAVIVSSVGDQSTAFAPHSPSSPRPESRDSFTTPPSSPSRVDSPALPEKTPLSSDLSKALPSDPDPGPLPNIVSRPVSQASQQQLFPLEPAFEDTPHRGRSLHSAYPRKHLRLVTRASSSLSLRRPPSAASMGLHKVSSAGQIAGIDDHDPETPDTTLGSQHFGGGDRSSADSLYSEETSATSLAPLPPLQSKGPDNSDAQQLEPLIEDDPASFDLINPSNAEEPTGEYALEKRADLMFSEAHLEAIFNNPKLLMKFTSFLNLHRPQSIPLLIYYLDALKALRAIKYANAIAEALDPIQGQDFTKSSPQLTSNTALEEKAMSAFKVLVQEDLPAYIAYLWIHVVSISIQRRITGTLAPHLREASEGLAETFCLTDPSRKDNPIVFASEEFARTTQYGLTYAIGRNCRFLQGPRTDPLAIRRLAMACAAGKEHNEVFVNYRRDGSPFLNLLMMAPLMDSRGNVRYYIGAQVDVSGLLKGCTELPALEELVEKEDGTRSTDGKEEANGDEFQELAEMFNGTELDTVRKYGGRMHKEYVDDSDLESLADRRPRVLLKDTSQDMLEEDLDKQRESTIPAAIKEKINGKLEGVYQHYLLVRPAPSLRILFTSPSLRVPGILQSPFLHRIGGSSRVRADLEEALADGRSVTAKVRWLLRADEYGEGDGRPRWIHCTPLLGHSGTVGVWMIVLVEEEEHYSASAVPGGRSKYRLAPPVSNIIGGKDWAAERVTEHRKRALSRDRSVLQQSIELENARRGGSSVQRVFERPAIPERTHAQRNMDGVPGAITSSSPADAYNEVDSSAPSPDVPKKRANRTSIVDFERLKNVARNLGSSSASVRGVGSGMGSSSSSRTPSYSAQHVVSQATAPRSASVGRGKKANHDFSFEL